MDPEKEKRHRVTMGLPIVGPVNKCILEFVGKDFLFSGRVCRDWRREFGSSRKETCIRNCVSSVSRVRECHECLEDDREFREKPALLNRSVRVGNLAVVQFLRSIGYSWNSQTFESAAENGNLDNMKWLYENKCPWGYNSFAYAAKNGNLENMKWLYENKCPWGYHSLENMKWLKAQGCPWSYGTFESAAENGNLENMKWLYENKCPWGYGACATRRRTSYNQDHQGSWVAADREAIEDVRD
jgi:hypothetical protein